MKEIIVGICCCLGMMSNAANGTKYVPVISQAKSNGENNNRSLLETLRGGNIEAAKELLADPRTNVNESYFWEDTSEEYLGPSYCDPEIIYREETVLLLAVTMEETEIVKELLSRPKIKVNKGANLEYRSPLAAAAGIGNIEILNLLLAHPKIDVNIGRGSENYSPLCLAAVMGNTEVVKILLECPDIDVNGGVLDAFDYTFHGWWKDWTEENSPLCLATRNGNIDVMKLLLARPDIDVNKGDRSQCGAPLYIAVSENNVEAVKLLLAHPDIYVDGCRVLQSILDNYKQWEIETAYQCAVKNDNKEIIQLLKQHPKFEE